MSAEQAIYRGAPLLKREFGIDLVDTYAQAIKINYRDLYY